MLVLGLVGGALASAEVRADPFTSQYAFRWHNSLSWVSGTAIDDAVCDEQATYRWKSSGFSSADCTRIYAFGESNIRYDVTLYGSDGEHWGKYSNQQVYVKTCSDLTSQGCQPPPVDCPSSGTPKRISTALTGYRDDNGVYREDLPEGGLRITIGGGVSAGGCGYAVPTPGGLGDGVDANSKISCLPNKDGQRGKCFQYQNLVATGEALEPEPGAANSYNFGDPEYKDEAETSNDTRESGIEKTSTEPVSEVIQTVDAMGQPVDLTVTRQTETTIERRGDGSSVETQDDISIITQSDGITKTTTETTTTTTNPDGSKTVETTENISYTQFPENVYTVDGKTNLVKKTEVPGGTAEQTVTTTKTVDPTGNVTSETKKTGPVKGDRKVKTKNDDPNQKAKDLGKKKRETCTTNPLMSHCIGKFKETAKGKFEDISSKIVDAQTDFETSWNDIRAEASSKLGFTLSGGGALQQHIVDIRGVEGDIGITRWVPYFDEFGLAALVMAAAALYATIIMFRG